MHQIYTARTAATAMDHFAAYARGTLHLVRPLFEDSKTGFVWKMRYYYYQDLFIQREFVFGEVDLHDLPAIMYFAEEKIVRCVCYNKPTSFFLSDKEKERYPGGLWRDQWADGISGLKGLDDMCLAVAYRVRTHRMSIGDAAALVSDQHKPRLMKFLGVLPYQA